MTTPKRGCPAGLKRPATVLKAAHLVLKNAVLDNDCPIETRVLAASTLIQNQPKHTVETKKMTTKINRREHKVAFQSQQKLIPAIAALTAIDHSVTCPETLLEIKKLIDILAAESSSNAAKIDLAIQNFDERPVDLIAQAQHGFFQIFGEIELIEAVEKIEGNSFLFQKRELEEKGFTTDQIAQIIPDPAIKVEENRAKIEVLNAEQRKLELFVNCHPNYDTDLLIGTRLEQPTTL